MRSRPPQAAALARIGAGLLLVLEAAYFIWFAAATARLFYPAVGFALPASLWSDALEAVVLALLGVRLLAPAPIPSAVLLFLSALAFVYGAWTAWSVWPILTSLSAVFEGDAVALQAASAIGFMAIGVAAMAAVLLE